MQESRNCPHSASTSVANCRTDVRTRMSSSSRVNPSIGEKMREEVIRGVETYIDAVRRNDPGALPLHPDVEFVSPLGTYKGVPAFEKGLADFFPILKGIEVIRLTADNYWWAAA